MQLHLLSVSLNKFGDIKYTYDSIERLLRQLESQGDGLSAEDATTSCYKAGRP